MTRLFDFHAARMLLDEAFVSVIRHPWDAARISLVPFAMMLALLALLLRDAVGGLIAGGGQVGPVMVPAGVVFAVVTLVFLTIYLVAVKWHRFVLLTVEEGGRQVVPVGATLLYALKSLVILAVCMFVVLIVMFIPLAASGETGIAIGVGRFRMAYQQGVGLFILTVIASWLLFWFFMAASPMLIETAVGGGEKAFEPLWRSRNRGGMFRAVAALICVAMIAWDFVGAGLGQLPPFLMLVVNLAISWLAFMVSISILTTIYQMADPSNREKRT